jgi:murein DD-endopeptidase MepM/ murein hydrolase activator NlpD
MPIVMPLPRRPRRRCSAPRTARATLAALTVLVALPGARVGTVLAQQPATRARVLPARPTPGSLVRVVVSPAAGEPVTGVEGTLAGEPLHFERRTDGAWAALGAVPLDAADSLVAPLVVVRGEGAREPVALVVPVPPAERAAPAREALRVDARFGRAPDSALAARIADESARALAVARRAHDTPRLWRAAWLAPREARVTSGFGAGRTFNGAVRDRHTGVDYAGATGAPVRAANRGVVALVDTFHLAGRVVYVDHGAGLVTGYFHLSRALVAAGDTVRRGQTIGRVGATGRVTGPHLHWIARYGAVTVDPRGLLALPAPPPAPPSAGAAATTTTTSSAR